MCAGEVFADCGWPRRGRFLSECVGVSGGDIVVGVEGGESVLKRDDVGVVVPDDEAEDAIREEGIVSG